MATARRTGSVTLELSEQEATALQSLLGHVIAGTEAYELLDGVAEALEEAGIEWDTAVDTYPANSSDEGIEFIEDEEN